MGPKNRAPSKSFKMNKLKFVRKFNNHQPDDNRNRNYRTYKFPQTIFLVIAILCVVFCTQTTSASISSSNSNDDNKSHFSITYNKNDDSNLIITKSNKIMHSNLKNLTETEASKEDFNIGGASSSSSRYVDDTFVGNDNVTVEVEVVKDLPAAAADYKYNNIPQHDQESQVVVNDLFGEIVRKRRQLPRRKDEDKEGFTEEEREAILLLHNSLRSAVSPSASNMVELTWDTDIEAFAQEWASKCTGDHRPKRDLKNWINMGENLYWQGGGYYEEKKAIDYWWNEKQHYTFDTKKCVSGEVCGHYITAAWAKSEKIGCGIRRCATLPDVSISRKTYYFVCNYSGRFLSNYQPYVKGTSCSKCPADYPKCRYNLCVSESMLTKCQGYNGTTSWTGVDRTSSVTDQSMDCPGFVDISTKAGGTTTRTTNGTDGDNSTVTLTYSLVLLGVSMMLTSALVRCLPVS